MNKASSSEDNLNVETLRARDKPLQDGLQRLQSAARGRNGVCLDTAYGGPQGYHKFRCVEGHEWEQTAAKTLQGSWCKACVRIERQTPIGVLHAIAARRGGRCLSLQTQPAGARLMWECHAGHVWQASQEWIRQGGWCPECRVLERRKRRANQVRDMKIRPLSDASTANPSPHPALARLRQHAARLGWRCLARAWAGYYVRYEFECANGHHQEYLASQLLFRTKHRPRCAECEAREALRDDAQRG